METRYKLERFHSAGAGRALVWAIVVTLALLGCKANVPPPPAKADPALSEHQAHAFIEALKPRRPGRPTVAVLALNEGTETTDFLLPHALLRRADIADVQAVAPRSGRVTLYPALQVEGAQDLASFDRRHPSGADYVIVPAMQDDNDPRITAWLQQQAAKGAQIIGICVGGLVLGQAGLLDGRRFASHWYYRGTLAERHPGSMYVPHQRYLIDRGVATTTGITASMPTMLALVEAIGGREKAEALAAELGVHSWKPTHDSTLFGLNASRAWTYLLNKAAFWRHERWTIDVQDGMDDIALALAADAWARTGRVSVDAVSASGPVRLRSGLVLVAQPASEAAPRLPLAKKLKPVQQLDHTLCEIGRRFGTPQRDWVMLEMEYADPAANCSH